MGDSKNMAYENWILIKEHGICETCIFIIIKLTRGREREREEKNERDCFNYFEGFLRVFKEMNFKGKSNGK